MPSLNTILGQRIRQLRKLRGLTQEELGQKAGIDYKHLGRIERGDKVASLDAMEKLATALEVDYYELLLPECLDELEINERLVVLVRELDRHGSPQLRDFLHSVLASARTYFST